jgi:hypothetical protein
MSDYIILLYVLKYYIHQFIFFTICLSEHLLLYIVICSMAWGTVGINFPKHQMAIMKLLTHICLMGLVQWFHKRQEFS